MRNLDSKASDDELLDGDIEDDEESIDSEDNSKLDRRKELIADLKSTFKEFIFGLIILGILIGLLCIYTWQMPPVVLVESNSMMHDIDSKLGCIDTGDLVLSKHVDKQDMIKTYVDGQKEDYKTYNSYGDVISFRKNGGSGTPIIHRAIVWVKYNESGHNTVPGCSQLGSFDVPSLEEYDVTSFTLKDYELSQYDLEINLKNVLDNFRKTNTKPHGGFITKGDNNPNIDQGSLKDSKGRTLEPVKMDWVIGKAEGEIPWLGLIRLHLTGQTSERGSEPPKSSVNMLSMVLALIFLTLTLIHFLFIHRERKKRRRRELEEDEKADMFQKMIIEKRELRKAGEDELFTKQELANFSENELLSFLENIVGGGFEDKDQTAKPLTIYDLKQLAKKTSRSEAKEELMQLLQGRPEVFGAGPSGALELGTEPLPRPVAKPTGLYESTIAFPMPTHRKSVPLAKQVTREDMMDILNLFLELEMDDDIFGISKQKAPLAKPASATDTIGKVAAPIARPASQNQSAPLAKPVAKPMTKPVAQPVAKQVKEGKVAPIAKRADDSLLGELMDMLDE